MESAVKSNFVTLEIKCDFGMDLSDWKCSSHGLLGWRLWIRLSILHFFFYWYILNTDTMQRKSILTVYLRKLLCIYNNRINILLKIFYMIISSFFSIITLLSESFLDIRSIKENRRIKRQSTIRDCTRKNYSHKTFWNDTKKYYSYFRTIMCASLLYHGFFQILFWNCTS